MAVSLTTATNFPPSAQPPQSIARPPFSLAALRCTHPGRSVFPVPALRKQPVKILIIPLISFSSTLPLQTPPAFVTVPEATIKNSVQVLSTAQLFHLGKTSTLFFQLAERLPVAKRAAFLTHYVSTDIIKQWAVVEPAKFQEIVDSIPIDQKLLETGGAKMKLCIPIESGGVKMKLCTSIGRFCSSNPCSFAHGIFEQMRYQIHRNPKYKTQKCLKTKCSSGCIFVHTGDLVRISARTFNPSNQKNRLEFAIQTEDGPLKTPQK